MKLLRRWASQRACGTDEVLSIPTLSFDAPSPPRVNPLELEFDSGLDDGAPPPYEEIVQPPPTRILKPLKFTFHPSPSRPNVVHIVPNSHTQLPYDVCIRRNAVGSSITGIIRRGSREIGDFEMGSTQKSKSGTLCIRGRNLLISETLTRTSMYVGRGVPWKERQKHALKTTWQYRPGDSAKRIFWVLTYPRVMTCYSSNAWDRAKRLATFHYQGSCGTTKMLEILPEGYDVVDDILMSGVILERWRLEGLLST